MWRFGRSDKDDEAHSGSSPDSLAAEAESFLCGRYAERLTSLGRVVPPWAWLNVMAHGTVDDLKALSAGGPQTGAEPPRRNRAGQEWRDAAVFLADHILAFSSSSGVPVETIQTMVLVPVELELAANLSTWQKTPGQIVTIVLAALHRHPSGAGERTESG